MGLVRGAQLFYLAIDSAGQPENFDFCGCHPCWVATGFSVTLRFFCNGIEAFDILRPQIVICATGFLMKKHIIIALVFSVTLYGCNKDEAIEAPAEITLDTPQKKVSYVVGYDTARRMQAEGFKLDADVMKYAIDHLNSGVDSELSEDEVNAVMTTFQTQIQEQHQAAYNQQSEGNSLRGQEFLKANSGRDGVVTTTSGLQYEVLKEGEGKSPLASDNVTVNYKGKLLTGEVFDSGDGVSFRVDQLIPGWIEALPLMKVGAKWTLFIPADLAYGEGGTAGIGPNSALIFEMELVSINEGEG